MTDRLLLIFLLAGMLWLPASVIIAQDAPPPGVTIHVVQRGETLFKIATDYGLSIDQLAQLNSLTDPSNIQVGQRLLVPTSGAESSLRTHIVQPGESLESIAQLYGDDPYQLAEQNNVTVENPLYVGQVLTLGVESEQPPVEVAQASLAPTGVLHTVISGDTLFKIATQYGLTVAEVAAANNITDPTLIFAGQQLLIPEIVPPQLSAELPAPLESLTLNPLLLVEGQTGVIRMATSVPAQITGTFLDHSLAIMPDGASNAYISFIGVPIFTDAGIYPLNLTLTGEDGTVTEVAVNIQVIAGFYGSEYINLLEDRTNLLDPNVEAAELSLIENIMGRVTTTRYFNGPMGLPAAAAMTSPFGTRRSYNGGGFDRYHAGADFAGAPGTPVLASAPGVVVMADTLNVRGEATIIDHGWGVFTGYWHQTDQYVQPGDIVEAGQVIGTIGATGRVTGAHLHWELWVNGVAVDPMQWVSQSF